MRTLSIDGSVVFASICDQDKVALHGETRESIAMRDASAIDAAKYA